MGSGKIVLARRYAPGAATPGKLCRFLILGVLVGMFLGFVLMGTAHAFLETMANPPHDVQPDVREQAVVENEKQPTLGSGGKQEKGGGSAHDNTVHILTTSNGSPYQNYQMRIAYATYQLTSTMPGGDRFVAFTRILHRTKPDELMEEIPTFRAEPLQPECDSWCEYPVSDRANAVHQFFDAAKLDPSMIKAPWLYMIESDYVFMKPLQLPPPTADATAKVAWAFPFDYINPMRYIQDMEALWPQAELDSIPNTGPAPLLMSKDDWVRVTPEWERLAARIESDAGMKQRLGWVREMYGFSIALAKNGIKVELKPPGQSLLIAQLPMDKGLGQAHAFHYTQCTIYKTADGDNADNVWGYDKRFYVKEEEALLVPRIVEPPSTFEAGKWIFVEGDPVTKEKHDGVTAMIQQMNRGIDTLRDLRAEA